MKKLFILTALATLPLVVAHAADAPAAPATTPAAATAASGPLTDAQVKKHLLDAGYTRVSHLKKEADGSWTAEAEKRGVSEQVTYSAQGEISKTPERKIEQKATAAAKTGK